VKLLNFNNLHKPFNLELLLTFVSLAKNHSIKDVNINGYRKLLLNIGT